MVFNLFNTKSEKVTLENLEKKHENKLRHMLLTGQMQISNASEMAYYQITRGALAIYKNKSFKEIIDYFSRGREYKKGDTIYFKDLIEVWAASADYGTGRININKIQPNPENVSATILILKLFADLRNLSFEYINEGNLKIGFKCPI